jgi:hypothetical protein
MLSDEVIKIDPYLLTKLLILKTKFGVGSVNPDDEVMKSYVSKN